jgi:hypothetical protein
LQGKGALKSIKSTTVKQPFVASFAPHKCVALDTATAVITAANKEGRWRKGAFNLGKLLGYTSLSKQIAVHSDVRLQRGLACWVALEK